MESKICRNCNIEKNINEYHKGWSICKLCRKIKYKETNSKKEKIQKEKVKTDRTEYMKSYYVKNRFVIKNNVDKYRINNKSKIKEYKKNWHQSKRNQDQLYKLMYNIRSLIYMSFINNGYKKNTKTFNILGCSYDDFKTFLENQFEEWMNWENQGKYTGNYNETWQIDHIIPISSANSEEEIIKLNHYTNLRPLCSRKNIEKSNSIK